MGYNYGQYRIHWILMWDFLSCVVANLNLTSARAGTFESTGRPVSSVYVEPRRCEVVVRSASSTTSMTCLAPSLPDMQMQLAIGHAYLTDARRLHYKQLTTCMLIS
ncbi:hypothetical protein J6590_015594 [Homalodisca vitripennis]|nr:hypothetical protein J6590_015594 [Homalodisca vitripennis]